MRGSVKLVYIPGKGSVTVTESRCPGALTTICFRVPFRVVSEATSRGRFHGCSGSGCQICENCEPSQNLSSEVTDRPSV
jgi:hypothetical protein